MITHLCLLPFYWVLIHPVAASPVSVTDMTTSVFRILSQTEDQQLSGNHLGSQLHSGIAEQPYTCEVSYC